MSKNENLGLLLEQDILMFIRVQSIFLILAIAIFSFTKHGKTFSLISLIISLLLGVTLVGYYFLEKDRISKYGFAPRSVMNIIISIMIGVLVFNVWVMYEVYHNEPTISLNEMVRGIESRMNILNQEVLDLGRNGNIREKHSIANQHLLNLHTHSKKNAGVIGAALGSTVI